MRIRDEFYYCCKPLFLAAVIACCAHSSSYGQQADCSLVYVNDFTPMKGSQTTPSLVPKAQMQPGGLSRDGQDNSRDSLRKLYSHYLQILLEPLCKKVKGTCIEVYSSKRFSDETGKITADSIPLWIMPEFIQPTVNRYRIITGLRQKGKMVENVEECLLSSDEFPYCPMCTFDPLAKNIFPTLCQVLGVNRCDSIFFEPIDAGFLTLIKESNQENLITDLFQEMTDSTPFPLKRTNRAEWADITILIKENSRQEMSTSIKTKDQWKKYHPIANKLSSSLDAGTIRTYLRKNLVQLMKNYIFHRQGT